MYFSFSGVLRYGIIEVPYGMMKCCCGLTFYGSALICFTDRRYLYQINRDLSYLFVTG